MSACLVGWERCIRGSAVSRQGVVAAGANPVGIAAPEHIDDMAGAEHLAGAYDCGKQPLRFAGCVEQYRRVKAAIAISSRPATGLPGIRTKR